MVSNNMPSDMSTTFTIDTNKKKIMSPQKSIIDNDDLVQLHAQNEPIISASQAVSVERDSKKKMLIWHKEVVRMYKDSATEDAYMRYNKKF